MISLKGLNKTLNAAVSRLLNSTRVFYKGCCLLQTLMICDIKFNINFLQFVNGAAQLSLGVDEVYTLTTLSTGVKGSYPPSPSSGPFPLPYHDDFEGEFIFMH